MAISGPNKLLDSLAMSSFINFLKQLFRIFQELFC
jgi:hypothetical protein